MYQMSPFELLERVDLHHLLERHIVEGWASRGLEALQQSGVVQNAVQCGGGRVRGRPPPHVHLHPLLSLALLRGRGGLVFAPHHHGVHPVPPLVLVLLLLSPRHVLHQEEVDQLQLGEEGRGGAGAAVVATDYQAAVRNLRRQKVFNFVDFYWFSINLPVAPLDLCTVLQLAAEVCPSTPSPASGW